MARWLEDCIERGTNDCKAPHRARSVYVLSGGLIHVAQLHRWRPEVAEDVFLQILGIGILLTQYCQKDVSSTKMQTRTK